MINVTKTYLPNIEKYKNYIDKIYKTGWVTNDGPLVRELEEKLAKYLGVKNIVLVANGTSALEIAYRTLELDGFAITTPFSFVATTSSLVTNGILPIFADIDKDTLCIEPKNIEKSITPHTKAIVPVHIFGNVCDIESIQNIAYEYNLKVIYDASHAFGIKYKGESVLNYGDISTLSFHATKLFHTIEGGALIINDDKLVEKARYLRNFGIENAESIPELGTNAKMNEFEAAMGLCMLDEIDNIISERKKIVQYYFDNTEQSLQIPKWNRDATMNYGYFPVVFDTEDRLLNKIELMNKKNIFPRRYFYPSLDTLHYIEPKQYMPVSRDISKRILALPLYTDLDREVQDIIINIINSNF